ncbi:hypothetical protein HYDPIDRAFT_71823, partial [Hydnomerulius pinastri MD-312]
SVAYSHDGDSIVSASDDQVVRFWDALSGRPKWAPFERHGEPVVVAGFILGSTTVVSLSRDGVVLVWHGHTGEIILEFEVTLGGGAIAALSDDGKKLLTVHIYAITIWDCETGQVVSTINHEAPPVMCGSFSPDASRAVLGLGDGRLCTWDVSTHELDAPLEGHDESPVHVAWSPDAKTIAS